MTVNNPIICDVEPSTAIAQRVRTVHEFEMAGVAAIQMEDQVAPKRCSHLAGKSVIDAKDFVQKLRAAVNEKYYADTLIVARTDARAVYDLDTAIERGKMYLDAGADVLFIEAPQNLDEVERIGKTFASKIQLLANQVLGGRTPRLTAKELEQLGFKICHFPGRSALRRQRGAAADGGQHEAKRDRLRRDPGWFPDQRRPLFHHGDEGLAGPGSKVRAGISWTLYNSQFRR